TTRLPCRLSSAPATSPASAAPTITTSADSSTAGEARTRAWRVSTRSDRPDGPGRSPPPQLPVIDATARIAVGADRLAEVLVLSIVRGLRGDLPSRPPQDGERDQHDGDQPEEHHGPWSTILPALGIRVEPDLTY